MNKKPLEIDMIAGSALRDIQGEMLSVEGADINDLINGKGRINDNHGKSFTNILGRVTSAKKIFKAEDCDDERQKYYWEKVKAPYIYVKATLFDDEDHANAKACAAILRNIHREDVPLKLKASVEGGVISRGIKDVSLLAQTKIHSVALTFSPANTATLVEPLNLDKTSYNQEADYILIKSVMHLAETNVPSFRHIARVASAEKITRNVYKIKELLDQGIQEEFNKGIKELATGAALIGALAGSPVQAKKSVLQSHENVVNKTQKINPHLWAIAQIESSGGKNLNHKTLNKGIHAGQTAGGPWGMMPKTAAYILKLSPKLASKYPDLTKKMGNLDKNHEDVTKMFNSNPKLAFEFANTLYNHLHKINNGDKDKITHAWHYGLKGTQKAIKKFGEDNIRNDEYVAKIKNSLDTLSGDKLKKALTAGYGGAGAPTGRTGGQVLMTEKLDDGRTGFRYIMCEHCGDEQIYAKNQVKCRQSGCGKSFSMASLYKVMLGSKKR